MRIAKASVVVARLDMTAPGKSMALGSSFVSYVLIIQKDDVETP